MTVQLTAHFAMWDSGSDIVRVLFNGTEFFSSTLEIVWQTADYATLLTAQLGDAIECVVDPISYYDDTTQMSFTVETVEPPTGSSCFSSGACLFGTEADCAAAEGSYVGDGVMCDPNPCESTPVRSTTWGQIKADYK